jgi:ATP-dependent Clp endopeptidase proteolytic subunit ClpP
MKEINRRWFSMKASDTEAEISIFDEIGIWGVTVADFKKELDAVKNRASIKLLLNSPGGSVFDGMAIYNLLAPIKDKLEVHVLGLAASIVSVIALAGKSLTMDTGTYFMIHDPWAIAMGTAKDFRSTADLLDQIGGNMADIYTARSSYTKEEIQVLMAEETWMTAQEAVDAGFADTMVEGQAIAALACDLSKFGFQHAPKALIEKVTKKGNPPATLRDFEALLRDAGGFSRSAAAGIAKKGFSAVRAGGSDEEGSGEPTSAAEAPTSDERPPKPAAAKRKTRDRIRSVSLTIIDTLKG